MGIRREYVPTYEVKYMYTVHQQYHTQATACSSFTQYTPALA